MLFNSIYYKKKVLITGHTGFKGSWLSTWLLNLGADVYGVSKDIPSTPSMFEAIGLEQKIKHYQADIRNLEALSGIINEVKPDFIFHLAAQAIVSVSYQNPLETFSTNIMGTANLLEVVRHYNDNLTVVLITSDKAYDNVEWIWGYRENDHLGGKDIYSGSKGGAELVIKSYWHSFLKQKSNLQIGIGRAGNVIGGGDWSTDRIVVDCMKAWSTQTHVELRCPSATRPWQHVLEPLSGYLHLGEVLNSKKSVNGEAFNFGPRNDQSVTVQSLTTDLAKLWNDGDYQNLIHITDNIPFHEAGLLKLNCDKALALLQWQANLEYPTMIAYIVEWYKSFYSNISKTDLFDLTTYQISNYCNNATTNQLIWTKS